MVCLHRRQRQLQLGCKASGLGGLTQGCGCHSLDSGSALAGGLHTEISSRGSSSDGSCGGLESCSCRWAAAAGPVGAAMSRTSLCLLQPKVV